MSVSPGQPADVSVFTSGKSGDNTKDCLLTVSPLFCLRIQVQSHYLQLLIDIGSAMNVISQKTSDKLNLKTRKLKYPITVRLADGALGTITSYVDLGVSLRDGLKQCAFRVKCRNLVFMETF